MKINLKKLQKIESSYVENPVCKSSLQLMVDLVFNYKESGNYKLAPANVQIALTTLKELGVIIDTEEKNVQQLNS